MTTALATLDPPVLFAGPPPVPSSAGHPDRQPPRVPEVIEFGTRTNPYRLPTLTRLPVLYHTAHTVRLQTTSGGRTVQPTAVAALPDAAAWTQAQAVTTCYQTALDALAAALRALGRYDQRLGKAAAWQAGRPEPICPTVIEAKDPDGSHFAWWGAHGKPPSIARYTVDRQTPKMLHLSAHGGTSLAAQSQYFVCPTDDDWTQVAALKATVQVAAAAWTAFFARLGTYESPLPQGPLPMIDPVTPPDSDPAATAPADPDPAATAPADPDPAAVTPSYSPATLMAVTPSYSPNDPAATAPADPSPTATTPPPDPLAEPPTPGADFEIGDDPATTEPPGTDPHQRDDSATAAEDGATPNPPPTLPPPDPIPPPTTTDVTHTLVRLTLVLQPTDGADLDRPILLIAQTEGSVPVVQATRLAALGPLPDALTALLTTLHAQVPMPPPKPLTPPPPAPTGRPAARTPPSSTRPAPAPPALNPATTEPAVQQLSLFDL
ncbi:MAG: hypothetical protein M3Z04_07200 [Chloroflexota bacterium]|nr:hypothetical protein [Chloroflexota bacterium]